MFFKNWRKITKNKPFNGLASSVRARKESWFNDKL